MYSPSLSPLSLTYSGLSLFSIFHCIFCVISSFGLLLSHSSILCDQLLGTAYLSAFFSLNSSKWAYALYMWVLSSPSSLGNFTFYSHFMNNIIAQCCEPACHSLSSLSIAIPCTFASLRRSLFRSVTEHIPAGVLHRSTFPPQCCHSWLFWAYSRTLIAIPAQFLQRHTSHPSTSPFSFSANCECLLVCRLTTRFVYILH